MNMKVNGFTLIELMVTVAIIAILATLALPSYERYISKSNRVDATTEIMKLAAEQEKYYLQKNSYATEAQLAAFTTGGTTLKSQNGYYDVAITDLDGAALAYQIGYIITLTPPSGTRQYDKDLPCRNISIDNAGQTSSTNSAGTDSTAECWK